MRVLNLLVLSLFFLSSCGLWQTGKPDSFRSQNQFQAQSFLSQSTKADPFSFAEEGRTPAAGRISCKELFRELAQSSYTSSKKTFASKLSRAGYSSAEAKAVKQNLDALLFIDYKDQQEILFKVARGELNLEDAKIFTKYDDYYGSSTPFENYVTASKYLMNNEPEFSFKTLTEVHKRMMKGGVDDIDPANIGKARGSYIIGNVPSSDPIPKSFYDEMVRNKYIDVSRLSKNSSGKYYGEIGYPNAHNFTDEVGKIVKKNNPELYEKLMEFRRSGRSWDNPEFEELTGELILEITEDLLSWFVKQKDQIGELNTVAKVQKYSKVVAEFQRSLISIHPFADGNGRSVRQFALYYPFQSAGLPVPRLSNPDADLYTPIDDWVDQIQEGLFNSFRLYDEMSRRLDDGLRIENIPELIFTNIPEKAYRFEKYGYAPIGKNKKKRVVDVVKEEFMEFSLVRLETDDDLYRLYQEQPYKALEGLKDEYLDFLKKSQIDFFHEKFGKESVELHFIDNDFVDTFANKAYKNLEDWQKKMDRYYYDNTVWRGLARQNDVIQEDEIISMFTDVHHQFVSNRVMGVMDDSASGADEAIKDFDQFNNDLVNGGLVKMAMDHSRAGELYGVSYGYSTSKKRQVGKAFAMGAMVIAEYGEHQDYQHLLKSRVLVGMAQGKKDVDLMRLKQVRNDFSNKYFRQAEVMGIGAADPDSTRFVQLIDENGDAFVSYVRNPKKPNEILVFDGEVSDLSDLANMTPSRKIRLP
ncbi:MAG: Fic family protein [Oligoflexia bacterium]|nr:Fic family protein [Oligoflexia bacterium]